MPKRLIQGGALSAVAIVCALALSANRIGAQSSLPSGWATRDIGTVGVAGSASHSSGTWTLAGSGAAIYDNADQFRFAYQSVTGDLDIRVRVASVNGADDWAKAGLMVRESLNSNSRNAFVFVTPGGSRAFQWRSSTGGTTGRTMGAAGDAPVWVRIVRKGNAFTGYLSNDGTAWTSTGSATISMATTAYVGLVAQSRVDSSLATATFTGYGSSGSASGLPAPWTNADIGSPSKVGSASASGGTFTVAGAGRDIWGTSDQFQFVYQQLQGDVEIIARVASLQYADSWSKAGVMIRESLNANAKQISMVATGQQGWSVPRRIATGGTSQSSPYVGSATGAAPGWVRLVREGNLFSAYRSSDGTTWTRLISDTIQMSSTVYVGLAVVSCNTSTLATATFTNVTARVASAGTNQPPTVSITSPSSGASVATGTSFTLSAEASDTDGTISKVDLYQGSTLLKSDNTSPYSVSVTPGAAGSYQFTAVATDSDGETTTSAAVTVTATSGNQLPSVSLTSPAANSTFTAPATVTVTATASDSDGSIAQVDFYRGSTLVSSDTTSPYSATMSNLAAGSYSLTAVARDNTGATRTSTAVPITVSTSASRPTTLVFVPSSDHATNVTSYTVAIYRAADPITGSPVATRDLGKPTPSGGEISVSITTLVDPLAAGSYKAVVRATGPGGTTASTASASFTK